MPCPITTSEKDGNNFRKLKLVQGLKFATRM